MWESQAFLFCQVDPLVIQQTGQLLLSIWVLKEENYLLWGQWRSLKMSFLKKKITKKYRKLSSNGCSLMEKQNSREILRRNLKYLSMFMSLISLLWQIDFDLAFKNLRNCREISYRCLMTNFISLIQTSFQKQYNYIQPWELSMNL